MTMRDTDLRLDGNAAAGLLAQVFATEMTSALGTCDRCGATNAFGSAQLYAHAPGSVLRCPSCTAILMCVVELPDGILVDLSGLRRIRTL
jgi:Family of unknown function (DUF6510)